MGMSISDNGSVSNMTLLLTRTGFSAICFLLQANTKSKMINKDSFSGRIAINLGHKPVKTVNPEQNQ